MIARASSTSGTRSSCPSGEEREKPRSPGSQKPMRVRKAARWRTGAPRRVVPGKSPHAGCLGRRTATSARRRPSPEKGPPSLRISGEAAFYGLLQSASRLGDSNRRTNGVAVFRPVVLPLRGLRSASLSYKYKYTYSYLPSKIGAWSHRRAGDRHGWARVLQRSTRCPIAVGPCLSLPLC